MFTKLVVKDDKIEEFNNELNFALRDLIDSSKTIIDVKYQATPYDWNDRPGVTFSALILYK